MKHGTYVSKRSSSLKSDIIIKALFLPEAWIMQKFVTGRNDKNFKSENFQCIAFQKLLNKKILVLISAKER